MDQKNVNIVLIILLIALTGTVGYLTLIKNPPQFISVPSPTITPALVPTTPPQSPPIGTQKATSSPSSTMTPLRDNSVLQLSLYGGSAELLVIDPKGKRTGLDPRTGTSFEEIPASSYGEESLGADDGSGQIMSRKLLWISRPLSGEYTVEVIGTGYARISLEVRPVDINSDGQRISVDGNMLALGVDTIEAMVTPGVSNVYRLTYSSTPDQPAKLIRLK